MTTLIILMSVKCMCASYNIPPCLVTLVPTVESGGKGRHYNIIIWTPSRVLRPLMDARLSESTWQCDSRIKTECGVTGFYNFELGTHCGIINPPHKA